MCVSVVVLFVLFVLCLCFCFFFFKQKTAYEMRISDWSSDVCSSDLGWPPPRRLPISSAGRTRRRSGTWSFGLATPCVHRCRPTCGASRPAAKIGRASCRERVCQYV